jgi:hypothetical protein
MSVTELLEVLPKAARPHCAITDPSQWLIIEEKLKTQLPADFKNFIGTYGTGLIGDFVLIFNPFSDDKPTNFFYYMDFILGLENNRRAAPLPLFPAPDGLLPFGKTIDGDSLFWTTKGKPDNWTIVVKEVRSKHYEPYTMNMTTFLVKLIVPDPDLQNDLLENSRIFKEGFDREAPFLSVWTELEKSLQQIKTVLINAREKGDTHIGVDKLNFMLAQQGLELETDLVQQQLKIWQSEGFIELLKSKGFYLRILENEP